MMTNKTEESKAKAKVKPKKRGKYDWVDTAGFTHRYSFDTQAIDQPRTTWIVLLSVTFVAFIIGCILIRYLPEKKSSTFYYSKYANNQAELFASVATFDLSEPVHPSAITKGPTLSEENEGEILETETFFVAGDEKVVLYNIKGEKINEWSFGTPDSESEKTIEHPKSLCFVHQKNHPLNNCLLIAFKNRIDFLNTAQQKATIQPFLTFDDNSYLTSLTVDQANLYVADYAQKIIYKYNGSDCKNRSMEIGQVTEANQEEGFLGLVLSASPYFDIAFHPSLNSILATNSVRFRIESFDAETGEWQKDNSWEKHPGNPNGFTGCCNPVLLNVFPNGQILTAEKGKTAPVKLFDVKGNFHYLINLPEKTIPLDGQSTLRPAILNDSRIVLLSPSGQLELFERSEPPK
ncbi:MAG: hypothetical protein Q4C95_11100 [Planctomycetia bacterium]|nr:hypothetical protein [Planctomycetia bacterium]